MLTSSLMRTMWPQNTDRPARPDFGLLDAIAGDASRVFADYGMTDPLIIAHAMAQFSHECGNGRTMTENINYTPERAAVIFHTRFSSAATCEELVGCKGVDPQFPSRLMDLVYGGRNGNVKGTDDGSKYIGRGLIQVTGRANYTKLGTRLGLDLVSHPELANEPEHALACAVAMFEALGCIPLAKKDDIENVTRKINGGTIGLQDRMAKLEQWKNALLQEALNRLGADPVLVTDGAFGKKSMDALKMFQARAGLGATGVPDDETRSAIDEALTVKA